MPSKVRYYQVQTPNKSGGSWLKKSVKNKRRRQIITGIIGAYTIVAAVFGYVLFGTPDDKNASANELAAEVSASLRIVEDDEFKVGDEVKVAVTMQNTSVVESINNLSLTLYTTNNSVKWKEASVSNNVSGRKGLDINNNAVSLPALSSGERVEYEVSGVLQESQFPYLAILAKVRYENSEGIQDSQTNKVFTKLDDANNGSGSLLSLRTDSATYSKGKEALFTLSYKPTEENAVAPQVNGKIYVTKNEEETVAALNCSLGDFSTCAATLKDLEAGQYTALFIDETDSVFSEIHEFSVNGSTSGFAPSSQASIEFPFGSGSINGAVAVRAERVMSLNDSPNGELCTFEVLNDSDKVVAKTTARVEADRSCFATINTTQISNGSGVYSVRLAGTNLARDIHFSDKATSLPIENGTAVLKTGQSVTIESRGVESLIDIEVDADGNPVLDADGNEIYEMLNGNKVIVGIWHPRTGDYSEIGYLNGETLQYIGGDFVQEISSSYFRQGGLYNVFIKTKEDSGSLRYSEFLALSFDEKEIGFSQSGVLVGDYDSLRAGQSVAFKLDGVTDKSGNTIAQGDCSANIYQTGSNSPIRIQGEIKDGLCSAVLPAGKVTKSGPALVAFSGEGISNPINQARQITFINGEASSFGNLQLEYEPARTGFANNLIIGPVTDQYGNLANAFGYTLAIMSEEDEAVREFSVNIVSGFDKITLPASFFEKETLKLKLTDPKGKVVKERTIEIEELSSKLILPSFKSEFTSDENIQVGISGLEIEEGGKCVLTYIKSEKEFIEEETILDIDNGGCAFDWNLTKYRENPEALLKLEVANKTYYKIVDQKSGEPSNMFAIAPQVKVNEQNELEIALLSSPIADKNGLPVESAEARFEYNGTIEEVLVENGLIKLDLPASKVQSKDIRNILEQRFLELGLDVRASVTSINKTNDVSVFLGTKNISNSRSDFVVERASSQVFSDGSEVFRFKAESCNARVLYDGGVDNNAETHWQAGNCYVQVNGGLGKHYLIFEDNGFDIGSFAYTGKEQKPEVIWCNESPCQLQVLSSIKGSIEAYLYDEGNQFKFESEDLDNLINIEQNGLNPLKDYLVEVRFTDADGEQVSVFNQLSGEVLIK